LSGLPSLADIPQVQGAGLAAGEVVREPAPCLGTAGTLGADDLALALGPCVEREQFVVAERLDLLRRRD
jgi:hypothetical protein